MLSYYQTVCIDRQTGREFSLRLTGADPEEARAVADAWGFITSQPQPTKPQSMETVPGASHSRDGKFVPLSVVAATYATGDMDAMLAVRHQLCHAMDRHYFLQSLAEVAYKQRTARQNALEWSEWACWQWLMEAPELLGAMRRAFPPPGRFVSVMLPKRLTILLEKGGDVARAAEVARVCQAIGLSEEDTAYLASKEQNLSRKL